MYGRRCKQTEIEHEVRITDFAVHYDGHPFTRDAKVGKTTADGLLTIDGQKCWVEIDNTGHMDKRQIESKWTKYGSVEGFILVVAVSEARKERLRKWSETVKDAALFTTFERLRTGKPWVDWYGRTVEI